MINLIVVENIRNKGEIYMVTSRDYEKEDHERILEFLRKMYFLNPNQHCLLSQRWIINEFQDKECTNHWHNQIRIWEDDGKIVAVGSTDYGFGVYIDMDPEYYHLTNEMIDWAETIEWNEDDDIIIKDGKQDVNIWTTESNEFRNECLTKKGYKKPTTPIYLNIRDLDKEIEDSSLPEGYKIRSMSEDIDLLKRYEISRKGFIPEDQYVPEISETFYARLKNPMYKKDLDIVTEYEDGTLASCCILWYDEITKTGIFEPVATHPKHRRKGLAKAMLIEGSKRLKALGGKAIYVDCFGDERKTFYNSAGFETHETGYFWVKFIEK